jgi:hypothetical protein
MAMIASMFRDRSGERDQHSEAAYTKAPLQTILG